MSSLSLTKVYHKLFRNTRSALLPILKRRPFCDKVFDSVYEIANGHHIFAGYPDKMEEFLRRNPGLRSRIGFHVPFDDYSAEELYQIIELLAENQRVCLDASVRDKLLPVFEAAMKTGDFGNGRYARNLLERAVMKQASRLVSMDVDAVTKADIGRLTADDFEAPVVTRQEPRRIGFSA